MKTFRQIKPLIFLLTFGLALTACDSTDTNGKPGADSTECTEPTVVEFFAYQCPHCYEIEKHLSRLKRHAKLVKRPTDLGARPFAVYPPLHYAAEQLGIKDKKLVELFEAIHERGEVLADDEEAIRWLVDAGANQVEARDAYYSDKVKQEMRITRELMREAKVSSVPTLYVNMAHTTSPADAGGYDKAVEQAIELLKKPGECATKTE